MHRSARRTAQILGPIFLLASCASTTHPPDRAASPIAAKNTNQAATPGITLQPANAQLAGDLSEITVVGATPGAPLELVVERPISSFVPGVPTQLYRAHAQFQADGSGAVALSKVAPQQGTYTGADLRGLFWSMAPTQDPIPAGADEHHAHLIARQGDQVLAEATIPLLATSPDVVITPTGPEFPGAFLAHLPDQPNQRRPAIIVLGGSEGNDWFAHDMAPRLASHGYAVLGLPYYAPVYGGPPNPKLAGLPAAFIDIPVDRLDQARDWLRKQPNVDGDHIALYGISKGAELVLIAASRMTWPSAVVAIVPTDVVWEGWGERSLKPGTRSSFSWHGTPLPFVPYDNVAAEMAKFGTHEKVRMRTPMDNGRAKHPESIAAARIPIEKFRGPLLVAGGNADNVWASGPMAGYLERTRKDAGLPITALVFDTAGHGLFGTGWSPESAMMTASFGGEAAANARAQATTWRATLDFFARSLPRP